MQVVNVYTIVVFL